MKNELLTVVGTTATDVADEEGTACQVGKFPVPFDVSTQPVVALTGILASEEPVEAINKSPTE
jgi:hypothetical protein